MTYKSIVPVKRDGGTVPKDERPVLLPNFLSLLKKTVSTLGR